MAGHRWYKGQPPANPAGKPRKGTSLAERIRETVNVDELILIALEISRGTPMVRVLDRATGRPRLADAPVRGRLEHAPGAERPEPVTMLKADEVIHDIVWPSFDDRMKAVTWIATMGGMKPPAEVDMHVSRDNVEHVPIDFSRLSPEELDAYVALVSKAASDPRILDVVSEEPSDEIKDSSDDSKVG